jgi:hypothetical protein
MLIMFSRIRLNEACGCPKAEHTVRTVGSSEDPMKSEALRAWAARVSRPKDSCSL